MNDALTPVAPAGSGRDVWQPPRQQQAFRRLMTAFSYPGRVLPLAAEGESALTLVLATLVDGACTLADPQRLLACDDLRRLGARQASVDSADFVLARGDRVLDAAPRLGSLENPERGATVVLRVGRLGEGTALSLQGPGIAGEQVLRVGGVDPAWWTLRAEWNSHFPLGVDLILVGEQAVTALPRTTRIALKGAH